MSTEKLDEIKMKIEPLLREQPISYAGVFGSFARGEEDQDSDIDILIRLKPNNTFSLFDLVGLQSELTDRIGRKVDLFTENGIDKYIRKYVMRDLRTIYSQ